MTKWLDRAAVVVEYLIALIFVNSGVQLFFLPDIAGEGPLFLLGTHVALVIYALWFLFWAAALVYSKIFKKKKLHRNTLMVLYLTTVYTSILTLAIVGWVDALDDIFVGFVIGACWLRWKFKTEYINPRTFHSSVDHFKDQPPPLP